MELKHLDDDALWARFLELSREHGDRARSFQEKWDYVVVPMDDPNHPDKWSPDRRAAMDDERQKLLDLAAEFNAVSSELFRRRTGGAR